MRERLIERNLRYVNPKRTDCSPTEIPGWRESRRQFLTVAGSSLLIAGCAGPAALLSSRPRKTGYVEVDQGRLYYETAGEGKPLVLLHAFTLDTRMWDAQFAALAARYRVIAYDARGFGRSSLPRPGKPYSHVDDLRALLTALDALNPHLVGASMGGRFALDFAVTHPGAYRSIALIDGVVGGWDWSREWLASYAPVIEASQRHDVAAAKAAWLAHPIFAAARGNQQVYTRLRRMVSDYSGWHFINPNPVRPVEPPVNTRLARLHSPMLSLIGEFDLPDFHRMAEKLEIESRAQRIVIPHAGHVAGMEAPERVNEQLLEFLARVA